MTITLRAPGHGRRQADPNARLAAENQRLRDRVRDLEHQLAGAGLYIEGQRQRIEEEREQRHAEVAQVARVLGEQVWELRAEQEAHAVTKARLDTALWPRSEDDTVRTDVRDLPLPMADIVPEDARPVPQYRPYRRFPTSRIRVVALGYSPMAAHPARVPGAEELAGVR
jgi:hypothetical protein